MKDSARFSPASGKLSDPPPSLPLHLFSRLIKSYVGFEDMSGFEVSGTQNSPTLGYGPNHRLDHFISYSESPLSLQTCTYRRSIDSPSLRTVLSRVRNELIDSTPLPQKTTTSQESVASSILRTLSGPQTTVTASPPLITAINEQRTPLQFNPAVHTLAASESTAPANAYTISDAGSYSNNRLPVILGPILGILALLALRVIFSKCRAYRRRLQKRKSALRSSLPQFSVGHMGCNPVQLAPPMNTLGRGPIIIHRPWSPTSADTKENAETTHSHAVESSLSSDGRSCDVFADSADMDKRSSHTSVTLDSSYSTEVVSTEIAFVSDASRSMDSDINMKDLEGPNTK